MRAVPGDIVKSRSTGELYRVKRIKEPVILLMAENTPGRFWLGCKESLELFYEKVNISNKIDFDSAG